MIFEGITFMIIGGVGLIASKGLSDESEFGRPSIIGLEETSLVILVLGVLILYI